MNQGSALNNHYLSSVLPYLNQQEHQEIAKTKEFYKP